jgi:hypothetical protein
MRAQKLREEATEKERDEHFNTIQFMIPMRKDWRMKQKSDVLVFIASNDDMDLLDDEESPLIKDGSPPLASMDVNMVFTLSAKFKGVDQEIA